HDAAVVLTVTQAEGVPYFMNGFFNETSAKHGIVTIKPVELLPQPMHGNYGARTAHLGFSKNVFQDGDVKIDIRNREEPPVLRTNERLHALKNFRRVILLP